MNRDEYIEKIMNDANDYIDENYEYFDSFEDLFDSLRDDITGNINGSYYCNSYKAKEAVQDLIFDADINEELSIYFDTKMPVERGPEVCDVYVRILLVEQQRDEIEELYNEKRESWESNKS